MRCFIKVTARSSFTRLRAIRWINRAHYHNENILERFTCISLLFKPPCCQTILTLFLSSHQAILTLSLTYYQTILTFSKFISSNRELLPNNTTDFSVFISSNAGNFRKLLLNKTDTFSEFIWRYTDTFTQTVLTFSVFILNNFITFQFHRITAKQYWLFRDRKHWHLEGVTTKNS